MQPTSFLPGEGWAYKMFDASAKLPSSGILQGNFMHFPGNFDSCLEVVGPGFTGKYVLLTFAELDLSLFGRNLKKSNQKLPNTVTNKFPAHKVREIIKLTDDPEQDPLALLKSGKISQV